MNWNLSSWLLSYGVLSYLSQTDWNWAVWGKLIECQCTCERSFVVLWYTTAATSSHSHLLDPRLGLSVVGPSHCLPWPVQVWPVVCGFSQAAQLASADVCNLFLTAGSWVAAAFRCSYCYFSVVLLHIGTYSNLYWHGYRVSLWRGWETVKCNNFSSLERIRSVGFESQGEVLNLLVTIEKKKSLLNSCSFFC